MIDENDHHEAYGAMIHRGKAEKLRQAYDRTVLAAGRRKIVQIAAGGDDGTISALCNDGSVWYAHWTPSIGAGTSAGYKWHRLPDIPQDEE